MVKRIKIDKADIIFHAYNEEALNSALMTINGEQKYFLADTPQGLVNKIASYLLNL